MKPVVNKNQMEQLSAYQKKRICDCKPKCKQFVSITTFGEGLLLCENNAKMYAYEILVQLKAVRLEKDLIIPYKGWTDQDVDYIKKYISEKGIYHGVYRDIANALNRTKQQVKSKVQHMKSRKQLH